MRMRQLELIEDDMVNWEPSGEKGVEPKREQEKSREHHRNAEDTTKQTAESFSSWRRQKNPRQSTTETLKTTVKVAKRRRVGVI
ncbi:unnamed protein product [Dibothriocephalus latus]|uniref:Uncharacterized protein n=1 Tax=Dibothriocephalus latus TaxID=60516 RepID=A0A3P6PYA5_DIBLA|nr:unnamed protein product [Dibothriocephalus latus]